MTSNRHVLILADDEDEHVPYVTKHLQCEWSVVNTGRISEEGLTYSFTSNDRYPTITYAGQALDLAQNADLSVWYRTVDFAQLGPELRIKPAKYHDYCVDSLVRLADALPTLVHPDAFWVSERAAIAQAELKPNQLLKAKRAGFNVPDTVYTSDPREAASFLREHGICVVKPLARRPPRGNNQYTRIFEYGKASFQGLNVNAHIFQQLIEPAFELRVAVVGTKTFAAIVSDNEAHQARQQGIRDFRHSFEKETFTATAFELPQNVANSCVEVVRLLGTVCGFLDLIVDQRGKYYFLEDNPNGQWAFVDDSTVKLIGQALARLLETGTC